MRWLLTTSTPWPMTHGTALRVFHLAEQLSAAGESVHLLSTSDAPDAPEGMAAYRRAGVQLVDGRFLAPAAVQPRCWQAPWDFDAALAERLASVAGQFDVVMLSGPPALQYAPEARRAGLVVADIIDDLILAGRRKLWLGRRPIWWLRRMRTLTALRRYERRFAAPANLVSFVTDVDADSYRARHRDQRVVVVPNGVDISFYGGIPAGPPDGCRTVAFVGNLAFLPNRDAVRYLLGEIAPRVWQRWPEVTFKVIGPNPPAEFRDRGDRRVIVTGWVEDVRPHLRDAGAVVLPMRIGTGIKNKLLEAWAAGRAVVATPLACQGVPAEDGRSLLLGASAEELAESLGQVLHDTELRDRIAAAGRDTACRECTWQAAAERLRAAVVQQAQT